MAEHQRDEVVWREQSPAAWLHDLRNGVNTAGMSVVLGRRLLSRGDTGGALDMLARAERGWAQCRDLLAAADDMIGPEGAHPVAFAADPALPPHRDPPEPSGS